MVGRPEIRVGLVGTGWIVRAHAHALHTLQHIDPLPVKIRLVSLYGRREAKTAALATELGIERYTTDLSQIVEDPEVDVIANVATNVLHAPVSCAALAAGKHVLCEKPLAAELRDALVMAEAAKSNPNLVSVCGFNYRFIPAVRLLHDLLSAGRLGAIRHYRGFYLQDWRSSNPQRPNFSGESRRDEISYPLGVIVEPATSDDVNFRGLVVPFLLQSSVAAYSHLFDMLLHLAGQPNSVSAYTSSFMSDSDDAFVAALTLPDSGTAMLEASRCATGWKGRHRVEVNGTTGSAWWDMEDMNRLHVFLSDEHEKDLSGYRSILVTEATHPFMGQWWPSGHVVGWEHTFVHQWRAFLKTVIEGEASDPLQATFQDGARAALLADALYASAKTGRSVSLGEGLPVSASLRGQA